MGWAWIRRLPSVRLRVLKLMCKTKSQTWTVVEQGGGARGAWREGIGPVIACVARAAGDGGAAGRGGGVDTGGACRGAGVGVGPLRAEVANDVERDTDGVECASIACKGGGARGAPGIVWNFVAYVDGGPIAHKDGGIVGVGWTLEACGRVVGGDVFVRAWRTGHTTALLSVVASDAEALGL